MNRSSAFFVGDSDLLIHCATAFRDAGHVLAGVLTSHGAIRAWANASAVPCFYGNDGPHDARERKFDFLFCVRESTPVHSDVIGSAQKMALRFHDSLLPPYTDPYAPSWALIGQEKVHGVTWHDMSNRNPGKGVVRQHLFEVSEQETAASLHAKCYEAGLSSFKALLAAIGSDGFCMAKSGVAQGVVHPPLPPLLGTLDFSQTAAQIAALVAGLDFGPLPNRFALAKIYLGDTFARVRSAHVLSEASPVEPGYVVRVAGDAVQVATGDGDILLSGCRDLAGLPLGDRLQAGTLLPQPEIFLQEALANGLPAIASSAIFWEKAYAGVTPVEFPYPHRPGGAAPNARPTLRRPMSPGSTPDFATAAFFAWLSVTTAQQQVSLMYCDQALEKQTAGLQCWLSAWVPMTLLIPRDAWARDVRRLANVQLAQLHHAGPPARDLLLQSALAPDARKRLHSIGISVGARALPDDMDLMLVIRAEGAELVSAASVFPDAVLTSIAAHFSAFLTAFSTEAPIETLPLAPAEEMAATAAINHTWAPGKGAYSVQQLVAAQARRTPDHAALCVDGQALSYRELEQRADTLAGRLQARGVLSGQIVGLCVGRGMDMMIAMLAILKAGAAYLPLDPDYPHDRLQYMMEDSQTPLVVTTRVMAQTLAIGANKACLLDAADEVVTTRQQAFAEPDTVARVAYLMYTSGSTGRPKGVLVTHKSLLNLFAGLDASISHTPAGRWLAVGSFSFDISVPELWWPLTHGFSVVIDTESRRGWTVAQAMLENQISHFFCTPSMATMLMSDAAGRQALAGLSVLMVGGEVFPLQLAVDVCNTVRGKVFNVYGPTEITVLSSVCELAEFNALAEFVPLGHPIANTSVYVRTAHGVECPAWLTGELLIGGKGVSDGYWRRPELTAERFIPDPLRPGGRLYKTGDLVRRRPDGAMEFMGRADHQVKIRGHRIELGEIESALSLLPGVKEAVVLARENKFGDRRLVAYVVPQADANLLSGQILHALAQTLPAIMVPETVLMLRAFSLTPNGKIDRLALPSPQAALNEDSAVWPEGRLETGIAEAWEKVLGAGRIAATDHFFELGGSLFLAVQVQQQLLDTLGHRVSVSEMVRFPTVRALARQLATVTDHQREPVSLDKIETIPSRLWATARDAGLAVHPALTAVESVIAEIWCDLFEVEKIGKDDDFFNLGGNSLAAIRMFAQLRQQFPVELPLASLFKASSLAGFAALVARSGHLQHPSEGAQKKVPWQWVPIVAICPGAGQRQALFCIHGAGGNVFNFKALSQHLGPEQPVYGLQPQGVDGYLPVLDSIEAMAAQYIAAIRTVDPDGPYQLLGYSAGGVIALEMAQQLKKSGAEITLLGMIDTLTPAAARRKPGLLAKLWLMRHWSLKFAQERYRHRNEQELANANNVLAEEKLLRGEWLSPELVEPHLFYNIVLAQNKYRPEPYHGPMVLFKASDATTQYLHAGDFLGWKDHIADHIKVIRIAGSHDSIMVNPQLARLAAAVQKELGKADDEKKMPASFTPVPLANSRNQPPLPGTQR